MIINSDCLDTLKELDTDSIDFVCTDPPYGYSFMGKDWDKAVPSVDIWRECLRVLKPGAFCCVMSAPRSDVQNAMISRLMEAGFRLDFTPIYWTYASGFPKAGNIGKLVDKRMGAERKSLGIKKRPDGTSRPNKTNWSAGTTQVYAQDDWSVQQMAKGGNDITAPATDQAKALDGSYAGFQPKPAVEVIIVAMKPLSEKTYVDQALKNVKGISWLDDGRIPTGDVIPQTTNQNIRNNAYTADNGERERDTIYIQNEAGRFPANLLVSDDVLNDGTITKSVASIRRNKSGMGIHDSEKGTFGKGDVIAPYSDSGSYSRYFDLDKWAQTLPFLIVPKASKSEKNKGLDGLSPKQQATLSGGNGIGGVGPHDVQPKANHHPTVKPLKLMSYLITLFSRPGDTVLDPFVGSGTTVVAAQQLDRHGIGIEREAEYAEIARARLAHILPAEPVTQPPVTMDDIVTTENTILEQIRLID